MVGFAVVAENHAGGEEFAVEGFGEFDADGVFAGQRQAENIDATGAEPIFDGGNLGVLRIHLSLL